MDILDEEILSLWKNLNKHEVSYIMVGGIATNLHGFSRMTADVDVWIKDDNDNRKKLRTALKECGLGDMPAIETIEFIPGWSSINLPSGIELDIFTSMKGFSQSRYAECYAMAPTAVIYEVPIKFLHINHLLEAKRATGRGKDKIDIEELEKIQKNNKQ